MSEMLSKWLVHYDPIHRGLTPRGIANGVCATNGFCFPRVAGGCNLYCGSPGAADVDLAVPVGAAGADAKEIVTFDWRSVRAGAAYAFVLRSVGGGGVESESSDRAPTGAGAVTVIVDELGVVAGLRPNAPSGLAVAPVSGGRFELTWRYAERGEEVSPESFRIYEDGGTGLVDYEDCIGVAEYRPRAGAFRFVTAAYLHGVKRVFGVRAVAGDGAEEANRVTVACRAMSSGPAMPVDVLVELMEVEDCS